VALSALVVSCRPGIDKELQSLDDNDHVGPEIGFVLHAQRRHRRELSGRDSVKIDRGSATDSFR
jgi:hypothetical protein